ncbi:MAG: 50S ribosomal protein L22 [Planctomycetota bacterium]|nr:50S ribosomal protein L22 [Planctomycetota bacterium]
MAKRKKIVPAGYGKTFRASHQMARISPFKARPVIDLIRGKGVEDAITLMEFEPRRAASMIKKVLRSALANASNDLDVNLKSLVVVDARVDGAGLLNGRRRWQPRAMGRAFPIMKRMSHISITLGEPISSQTAASAGTKE